MSLFVVRHADKAEGEFRTPGLPLNDQPLSECGREKSLALVGYFDAIEIASISVSEYVRTRQTIDAVARAKGIAALVDPRLNEINIGIFENLSEKELEERYPDFWDAFIARDRDFRFPGGESGDEALERVMAAVRDLDRAKNHILVAHDGLIRVLVCGILGLPPYRRHLFEINYCAVTEFAYDERFGCWIMKRMNCLREIR